MTPRTTTLTVELGDRSYPIHIGSGWLSGLGANTAEVLKGQSVFVVSDTNVAPHYLEMALSSLRDAGLSAEGFLVEAGEPSKSHGTLMDVYDQLLKLRVPRQGAVIALGGGVVGDLAGYAAATYLRGVDFIQVPTSLVAMVDSSVGGKTGINHPAGKNLIGAFWQPRMVFVDTDCLKTLPRRELIAGMGEVIKHGVIRDPDYFAYVEEALESILAVDGEAMGRVVEGSCRIKAAVVAEDEREISGVRAILNFGHTLGHAIEKTAGYGVLCHGEAVALGMEAAGRLALMRGLWTEEEHRRMGRLIERTGLPRRIPSGLDLDAALAAMKLDKKVKDGRVRFVLPTKLGAVTLVDDIGTAEVRSAALAIAG